MRRCSQATRMEAAAAPKAPSDISGVWDALCSGQPPPAPKSQSPEQLQDGCTGADPLSQRSQLTKHTAYRVIYYRQKGKCPTPLNSCSMAAQVPSPLSHSSVDCYGNAAELCSKDKGEVGSYIGENKDDCVCRSTCICLFDHVPGWRSEYAHRIWIRL